MKPAHPTTPVDDDSDGEEEVLQTWQVTKSGTILVVPDKRESPLPTSTASKSVGRHSGHEPVSSTAPSRSISESSVPQPIPSPPSVQQAPQSSPRPTRSVTAHLVPRTSNAAPVTPSEPKSAWFLGGNHIVKLLTSVDGDFDPNVLSNLATVPAVVGELALSVESLVSDDATVGGFEDDILAKIAANTLAAKRAAAVKPPSDQPQKTFPQLSTQTGVTPALVVTTIPSPLSATPARVTTTHSPSTVGPTSVPNPLASYKPVPNPLARVTPPASPVTTTSVLNVNGKRKDLSSSSSDVPMRKAKISRCESIAAPMIQAM